MRTTTLPASAPRLGARPGARTHEAIRYAGAGPGFAAWGPYLPLAAGAHVARWRLDPAAPRGGVVVMDVCADAGRRTLAEIAVDLDGRDVPTSLDLAFHLERPVADLEVRLRALSDFSLALARLEIVSIGVEGQDDPQDRAAPADAPVYFMHIAKTAGTSTQAFLRHALPAAAVCPFHTLDELMTAALDGWSVYLGHFAGLPPILLRRRPVLLTQLRDPVARTASHIAHVRRDPNHPLHPDAAGLSIAQYCRSDALRFTVEDYQSRQLASLAAGLQLTRGDHARRQGPGAMSVSFEESLSWLAGGGGLRRAAEMALACADVVGLAERHARTLTLMAWRLNLAPPTAAIRENADPAPRPALSARDVDAIEEVVQTDLAVYRAARERFEAADDAARADGG